ncbi:MAG: WYL domain-containing protein [Sideroxyarcus sp.]|nr:WYL domain-containing protein [Sideroxyarcus sp.]
MPSNEKASVMRRQWELLMMLPSSGTGKTALDLTRLINESGYAISKRQVERDLVQLRDAFKLEHDEYATPRGWRWPNGLSMTISEALSLTLLEATIKSLMPVSMLSALEPRFKQARGELARLSKVNRKAKWASKVRVVSPAMPLIPPKIDPTVLSVVQEALLADEQIEVKYQGMGDDGVKTLQLSPLGLVIRGASTYLVASASDEVKLYVLHRMRKATRSVRTVKRPANFDLDEYIKTGSLHFGNGNMVKLKAWVKPWLARILEETPLSLDQTLKASGDHVQLTATVADTWQLDWWLLSQGTGIEVMGPAALRKRIGQELKGAAAQYERG